jgi:hypothetical protein
MHFDFAPCFERAQRLHWERAPADFGTEIYKMLQLWV